MRLKDVLIGIFALALVGSLAVLWLSPAGLAQAPSLVLTSIEGKPLQIPDPDGRPQLVVFWATTCPGCIKEMPHLVELYEELAPRGLEIIGVAMAYDPPDQVINLAKTRKLPYPIALDIQGGTAQAFGDVRLTPTSFLIGPNGRIVYQTIGEMDMDRVHRLIVGLLDRQASGKGAANAVD